MWGRGRHHAALAVQQVAALDADGPHLHDDAARAQRRVGHLLVAEDLGTACLVVHRSAHGATLPSGDQRDLDQPLGPGQRGHGDERRGGAVAVEGAVARRHHRAAAARRPRRRSSPPRRRTAPCRPRPGWRAGWSTPPRPARPPSSGTVPSGRTGTTPAVCSSTSARHGADGVGVVGGGRGDRVGGDDAVHPRSVAVVTASHATPGRAAGARGRRRASATVRSSCSRSAPSSSTGPHLPFDTDLVVAREVAEATVAEVGDALDCWLLPPLAYTKSNEHAWSAGTVWLSATTLLAVLDDIGRSVATLPARKLVFFNGHGGNSALLGVANRELRLQYGLMTFLAHPGHAGRPGRRRLGQRRRARHGHPRRHRRDLADAAPAARARRHGPGHPQRARVAGRQPPRALRRAGRLRLAVERLRPRRSHRRPDGGHRRAGQGAVRGQRAGLRRGPGRGRRLRARERDATDLRIDGDRLLAPARGAGRHRAHRRAATAAGAAPAWPSPTRTATAATSW